jgi:hypothetical protein
VILYRELAGKGTLEMGYSCEREERLKKHANIVVQALPEDREEAIAVLAYARNIVDWIHQGHPPMEARQDAVLLRFGEGISPSFSAKSMERKFGNPK